MLCPNPCTPLSVSRVPINCCCCAVVSRPGGEDALAAHAPEAWPGVRARRQDPRRQLLLGRPGILARQQQDGAGPVSLAAAQQPPGGRAEGEVARSDSGARCQPQISIRGQRRVTRSLSASSPGGSNFSPRTESRADFAIPFFNRI